MEGLMKALTLGPQFSGGWKWEAEKRTYESQNSYQEHPAS